MFYIQRSKNYLLQNSICSLVKLMSEELDLEWHEKMAKSTFNETWDYIEKEERSKKDEDHMVHAAHTSRYHWQILVSKGKGTPVNLQRGEWLLARVYTILKRAEPAIHHAKVCLEITEDNNIKDFDLAFAYEAMARASALAGNKIDLKKYYELAKHAGEKIKKKEDKNYFFEDFNAGDWFAFL